MKTEHREKKDNDIVVIKNKTKNQSNMFDLVCEICELSGNKVISKDENSIPLKLKREI